MIGVMRKPVSLVPSSPILLYRMRHLTGQHESEQHYGMKSLEKPRKASEANNRESSGDLSNTIVSVQYLPVL